MQVLEFLFLVDILIIFRSRPLPAFYTLGIEDIGVSNKIFNYILETMVLKWS
jgi:hypothetical protein